MCLDECGDELILLPAIFRYANMDYVFASVLQAIAISLVIISYDIACQWFINLHKRIDADWPASLRPAPSTTLIPAIPKLHEPMHQHTKHQGYSFNYIPGSGLTDGECPERIWAPHNTLANSTKTQGPGSRQDVLDDHFGFWNWLKYVGQGKTLVRRYKAAIADRNQQTEAHRSLTECLDRASVDEWEKLCCEWETEIYPKTKVSPYESETTGMGTLRCYVADILTTSTSDLGSPSEEGSRSRRGDTPLIWRDLFACNNGSSISGHGARA